MKFPIAARRRAALLATALLAQGAAAWVQAESLYSEQSFRPLVADRRARLPGDVLTVLVYETSSASTSADTALQRKNDIGLRANYDQRSHQAGIGVNNSFDGGGVVQRSGKVLAQLSVTVTQVAENGDLLVAGEQDIVINADRQHIKLEGRVRPIDIGTNNTVQSNRLADARISYVGDGDLAERQRPGWWSKVMTWLGF